MVRLTLLPVVRIKICCNVSGFKKLISPARCIQRTLVIFTLVTKSDVLLIHGVQVFVTYGLIDAQAN